MAEKVLVIEDEAPVRERIVKILAFEGFDAFGAEDGGRGLAVAREREPDLIVCDILMPDIDGFEVCRRLRNDPATETIPLLFVTALGARESIRRSIELGVDGYVTKPFRAEVLVAAVRARIGRPGRQPGQPPFLKEPKPTGG